MIPTQTLGRTGVPVTVLGYGAMELRGGQRGRPVADPGHLLNRVLDSGITFIDTSIDYGISEDLIGEHLAHRRNEYFLATKCGCPVGVDPLTAGMGPGGPPQHIYTRENIVAGVEQSLRRMKTDHLDLVQFHGNPSRQVLEENGSVEALQDLQRAGKVRFIGMSSTLPHLADHVAMGVFDAFQIPYSVLQREHEAIMTEAAQAGAGIVNRGGAARGAPEKGFQTAPPIGVPSEVAQDIWEKARLDDLLDGQSRMAFTLRFTISHPDLHTTIVGTINPDHLQANLDAVAQGPLPGDVYEEAKRRLEKKAE